MIEAQHLTKFYDDFLAVDDVSFSVAKDSVTGFLGPNGAGKSTTLRIVAGYLGATHGDVRIRGVSVADDPIKARASIGYMPEMCPLYPEMRVREYLRFRAELKGVGRTERKSAVSRSMEDAGLLGREETLIGELSKGYRQRVGLADALVANPPLLILDEPTAGLDPNQIREVRTLIQRLAEDHTILISTHILSEVEAMCTRGIVIDRGKVVAEGSIEALRDLRRSRSLKLVVRGDPDQISALIGQVQGTTDVAHVGNEGNGGNEGPLAVFSFSVKRAEKTAQVSEEVVRALVTAKLGVVEIAPKEASLEQVFSELTQPVGKEER